MCRPEMKGRLEDTSRPAKAWVTITGPVFPVTFHSRSLLRFTVALWVPAPS